MQTNRMKVLGLVLGLAALICLIRLFQLQILDHQLYTAQALEEHLRKYQIPAERGEVYVLDRDRKVPLALNQNRKILYADPRYIFDRAATAASLAEIIDLKPADIAKKLDSESYYVVLERDLDRARVQQVEQLGLSGIGLLDSPKRVYPESSLAAQVVGFVNTEGVGQYGVEAYFDELLRGTPGLLSAKTDTRGIPIATADNVQINPTNGDDIVLSLDRNVQAKVESVLAANMKKYSPTGASAVVMNVNDGRVLAMANLPAFDPNEFTKVEDYAVFANRVVSGLYEPGSVIKGFTMAAALDTGAVAPTTTYRDTGSVVVDGWTIDNAAGIPAGTYSMHQVIAKSINSGVVFALKALGGGEINARAKQTLHRYFTERFKLGEATDISLPGDADGTINQPTASNVNYANMTFGQGMTATMLQIASGYAALVNGGTLYKPRIVDHIIHADGQLTQTSPEVRTTNVVSSATQAKLAPMFEAVIEETGDAKITGYRLGGKSGTAQIPNPAGGYFEQRDIGSFVGIVTLDRPEYVIMVRIDEPRIGTFASAAARPMFADIAEWLINYTGQPPGE